MKIISVSGSYSNVGKTTIVNKIVRFLSKELQNSKVESIKLGHGEDKNKKEKLFHSLNVLLKYIMQLEEMGDTDFLIIESNSIFGKINPDFAVFIEGNNREKKESATNAKKHADLIVSFGDSEIIYEELFKKFIGGNND